MANNYAHILVTVPFQTEIQNKHLTIGFSTNMHMRKNYEYKALFSSNVNMHMRKNLKKNTK